MAALIYALKKRRHGAAREQATAQRAGTVKMLAVPADIYASSSLPRPPSVLHFYVIKGKKECGCASVLQLHCQSAHMRVWKEDNLSFID